jgi:hypothetical protein
MDHHDVVPSGSPAGMVNDPDRDIVLGHEFVGEVPAALDETRRAQGPPRIVVHP